MVKYRRKGGIGNKLKGVGKPSPRARERKNPFFLGGQGNSQPRGTLRLIKSDPGGYDPLLWPTGGPETFVEESAEHSLASLFDLTGEATTQTKRDT